MYKNFIIQWISTKASLLFALTAASLIIFSQGSIYFFGSRRVAHGRTLLFFLCLVSLAVILMRFSDHNFTSKNFCLMNPTELGCFEQNIVCKTQEFPGGRIFEVKKHKNYLLMPTLSEGIGKKFRFIIKIFFYKNLYYNIILYITTNFRKQIRKLSLMLFNKIPDSVRVKF